VYWAVVYFGDDVTNRALSVCGMGYRIFIFTEVMTYARLIPNSFHRF
jgi:hypothetical protein